MRVTLLRHLVVPLALLAAGHAGASTDLDACSCIAAVPRDVGGSRVEVLGMSVVPPFRGAMRYRPGDDSRDVVWRKGGSIVSLGDRFDGSGKRFDAPEAGACAVRIRERRALVTLTRKGRVQQVVAEFEAVDRHRVQWLAVAARSRDGACRMAAGIAWSLRGAREAPHPIRIVRISRARTSFLYEVVPGSVVEARLGDVLMGQPMDVKAIARDSVTVTEWIPDGAGGWNTREKRLLLRDTSGIGREPR